MRIEHTGGAAEAGIAAGIGEFLQRRLSKKERKEQEEREQQWELEAENRARLWEIEKMEIRSRLDFEREEKLRQRKLDEIESAVKQIDETDWIPEEKKEQYKEMLYMKKLGVTVPARMVAPELYERPPAQTFTQRNIQQGLGELTTGAPVSMLGIPIEALRTKQEHIDYATNRWGPDWEQMVPQAAQVIEAKFPDELPKLTIETEKILSDDEIDSYLIAAGGDIEKAKEMARIDGYRVE